MRICSDAIVSRHNRGVAEACGGDDDLIGGVAVERPRQPAAFDEDGSSELEELEARARDRQIDPVVDGTVEDELSLLDFLRDFPDGNQREGEPIGGGGAVD